MNEEDIRKAIGIIEQIRKAHSEGEEFLKHFPALARMPVPRKKACHHQQRIEALDQVLAVLNHFLNSVQ